MRRTIVFCLLLSAPLVLAGASDFDAEFDAEQRPWQEIQAQFPATPKVEDLVPFVVSSASRHGYFLDRLSLSAGADGVVRYSVLIRTAGGAENVSFEGMRCATGERKIYAFGRPGGEWSRNKRARWEPIQVRRADSYQRELFFHYFCSVDGAADMKVIERALRVGGIRRGGD
jgi:hypothetical protein